MKLQEEIWRKAVADLEQEVMRACATLSGGKSHKETVEMYAARVQDNMDKSLARLEVARRELAAALKGNK